MREYRNELEAVYMAGIKAVAPDKALLRHVSLRDSMILVDNEPFHDLRTGKLYIVGAGKGAAPMARAAEILLKDYLAGGFVVVKTGHEMPLQYLETASASHPTPDEASQRAALRILEIAGKCEPGDLLLCLLTGGASSLTTAPAPGITIKDMIDTTETLLACGADIQEINAIRKHLSIFSGGRLAKKANGAALLSLIISDVIGDDISAIASSPTAPDPTTFADCMKIISDYDIAENLPPAVIARLSDGSLGKIDETPGADEEYFKTARNEIVASNGQALAACADMARKLGRTPIIISDCLKGEARETAGKLVEIARSASSGEPLCILGGGETTVTLSGKGKGGRNQEMALAASLAIENDDSICALFAGTDGTDGPTSAAGGFAFADSVSMMGGREKAGGYLANNDSWHALKASRDLFLTGPTLTNVMDLAIIFKN